MIPISLSTPGAAFVAAFEGYRAECYDDSERNCTIGIGHLVHFGPTTPADRAHWGSITRAHAYALLQADAHRNGIAALEASLTVKLTQAQVDALISLGFNAGPGALAPGHAVMSAVNSKPRRWRPLAMQAWHRRVRVALLMWAHPAELTRRRESEAYLFATSAYTRAQGNRFANAYPRARAGLASVRPA